jgi:hypothetical protein
MTITTPINGQETTTPPACIDDALYIVQNGELKVQQLYQGDSLEGLFRADEFDMTEFNNDGPGYTTNTTARYNYAYEQLQFQENLVKNINQSLNGIHVVVVIKNIDGIWNAFDNYCVAWDDNGSDGPYQCQNPIDFIVNQGWISIPPLGTDVDIDDIQLLGVYLLDDFNHDVFDLDKQGWLDNVSNINYVNSAVMKEGGIEITDPTLEGKHLVIVFRDNSPTSQSTDIIAEKGFCNDKGNGYPFDSLTFSVQPGDVLDYDITVGGTEMPIPLFDIQNDDGSEFQVMNGDHMNIQILKLPSFDDNPAPDTSTPTDSKLKVLQEEEEEPVQPGGNPFGMLIRMENGDQIVSETDGFGWALPIELVNLAVNDPNGFYQMFNNDPNSTPNAGTAQNTDPNNTDDGFNPFSNILSSTETTISFGGDFLDEDNGTVSMEIVLDIETAIAIQMNLKRTQEQSPDMTVTLDLTSDLTVFKDRLENPEDNNQTITTSPGYESLLLIAGLIGLVLLKKKRY